MANSDDLKNLAARFKIPSPTQIDQNQTVLLVEDQQDQRLILTHHLSKIGYKNVKQCSTGLDALDCVKSYTLPISVIVASMEDKIMGAIDLLRELKDSADIKRPPFLISMHSPNKQKIMLATETGVDEILVKPYTLKDIVPKMQRAFKFFHNPLNPEKVYELAKDYFRNEKFKEAKSIYTEIAKLTENAARPLVGLARIAIQEKDLDSALQHLESAEQRNQNYVHIFSTRGKIFLEQGKKQEAVDMFTKAIDMSPLNPMRYDDAATVLFELRMYQESIKLLSVAIKNELSFPKLHHYLSQAFYAEKDFKSAIRHIRSALNQEPENITYLNQLGISYKESEQYEDATKVYNSIIKLDPENKAALYNKSILLHTMDKIEESIKILNRIIKLYPDFGPALSKIKEYEDELNRRAEEAS